MLNIGRLDWLCVCCYFVGWLIFLIVDVMCDVLGYYVLAELRLCVILNFRLASLFDTVSQYTKFFSFRC
jgi:hypothetical protein